MLYKTIDTADMLMHEFRDYNRDNYSYDGYKTLLEIFEDSNTELDVIAICCDFVESSEDDIRSDFDIDSEASIEDFLSDRTLTYRLNNGNFLYQAF